MKRGIIILVLAVIVLLLILFFVYSPNIIGEDEGALAVMKYVLSFQWLFDGLPFATGGYGKCISDVDCGLGMEIPIGKKVCNGNEIWQSFRINKCDNGKCVKSEYSRRVETCSGETPYCWKGKCVGCDREPNECEKCDYTQEPPKIVNVDGGNCDYYGNEGICKRGKCLGKNCKTMQENFDFQDQMCGNTCCEKGKICCGGPRFQPVPADNILGMELKVIEGEYPICCDSETETCEHELDIQGYLQISNNLKATGISNDDAIILFQTYRDPGVSLLNLKKSVVDKGVSEETFNKIIDIVVNAQSEHSSYFCKKIKNTCEEKGMKICPGTRGNACCPVEGPGSACVKYVPSGQRVLNIAENIDVFFDAWNKQEHEESPIVQANIGACGNSVEESCGKGYHECDDYSGKMEGGVICCKDDEECVYTGFFSGVYGSPIGTIAPFNVPKCQPKTCSEGYSECSAEVGFDSELRICCKNGVETCFHDSSDYLRCVNIAEKVDNPSKTKATSVYMIRNESDFSLDGEAFVISPPIDFQDYIEITIRHKPLGEEERVFKYHDHDAVLESCDAKLVDSVEHEIKVDGGQIDLNNELIIYIPPTALSEGVNITLSLYELSDCYEVGENRIFVGGNHTVEDTEAPKKMEIDYRIVIFSFILLVVIILTILYFNRFRRFKKSGKKKKINLSLI